MKILHLPPFLESITQFCWSQVQKLAGPTSSPPPPYHTYLFTVFIFTINKLYLIEQILLAEEKEEKEQDFTASNMVSQINLELDQLAFTVFFCQP